MNTAHLRRVCGGLLLLAGLAQSICAQPTAENDAAVLALLQRIQSAAHTLDYAGVFTHQQGDTLFSSRIVHMVDGTGERERLEHLDGEPREYLRHNEVAHCLMPRRKLVIRERGRSDRFPGLLIGTGEHVARYYRLHDAGQRDRVAGRTCKVVDLEPQDALRYGYRLCTDAATELLLKVQIFHAGAVIDQVAFTSVQLGREVSPAQLQSPWNTKDWAVQDARARVADVRAQGWRIAVPQGYRAMTQLLRPMAHGRQVSHLVLSDGLAAISVFIEPVQTPSEKNTDMAGTTMRHGALSIHKARIDDYGLTLLGDVPPAVLQELVERTQFVPPPVN